MLITFTIESYEIMISSREKRSVPCKEGTLRNRHKESRRWYYSYVTGYKSVMDSSESWKKDIDSIYSYKAKHQQGNRRETEMHCCAMSNGEGDNSPREGSYSCMVLFNDYRDDGVWTAEMVFYDMTEAQTEKLKRIVRNWHFTGVFILNGMSIEFERLRYEPREYMFDDV